MKSAALALLSTTLLSACTVAQSSFRANPPAQSDLNLCGTERRTENISYKRELQHELLRRGIDRDRCDEIITARGVALTLGVLAVGVTAMAVANGASPPSFGGGSPAADWGQFYDQHGHLVWQCREITSGQFTEN